MSFNSVYFRPSLRPGVCWLVWVSARRCKIEQRTNFPEVGVCVCPWPVPCLSSRHSWCSTNLRITWTWTLSSGWTTTCKTGKRRCSSSLTTSLSSITFAQTSFISIRYTYIWPCFVFWVLWYRAFHWNLICLWWFGFRLKPIITTTQADLKINTHFKSVQKVSRNNYLII